MLFLHDVHAVIGEREMDLDAAIRDVYAPRIADDDARLLWYLYSIHGAGDGYHVVVVTALRDGAAWERLTRRLRYGDLGDWLTRLDALTYSSHSTLMVPTEWSPTAALDLDAVPVEGVEHEIRMFREDTLEGDAIEGAVRVPDSPAGDDVLTCLGGFRPALSPGGMVRVLYRIGRPDVLEQALDVDPGWGDWSGSCTPALPTGAHGSSRALRNVSWSPLA